MLEKALLSAFWCESKVFDCVCKLESKAEKNSNLTFKHLAYMLIADNYE